MSLTQGLFPPWLPLSSDLSLLHPSVGFVYLLKTM